MIEQITMIIFHAFQSLGAIGIFISMFIENIGIPLPTEIGYLLGQELISSGTHSWLFILAVLTMGHTCGAIVSYYFGRLGDNKLSKKIEKSKKFKNIHEKLENWYSKYGSITVFATRFIGYVRPWSSFVAGFSRIKFTPFIIWTFLGSLLFNIISLFLTGILIMVWREYEYLHIIISVVGFLLFFGLVIVSIYKYLIGEKN